MPTIDNLNIEINAQAVKANEAIDRLVTKLDRLTTSLSKIDGSKLTGLANGVQKLGNAMQTMNTIKTSDFTRLATNLTKLGTVNTSALNNAASSMSHLTRAFNGLGTVSANAQAISDMAKNISKLGNKSVQTAIANIPQLATALNNLMTTLSRSPRVSQNIIQMTNALANLASQGSRVGSASNTIVAGLNRSSSAAAKSSRSFKGLASAIGKFYASYFLVVRGVKKLWSAIESTTDYIEAYNYFNVSFGKIASEWDKDFEKYGYSNAENYANSFTERINETLGKLSGVQINGETGLLSETGLKNLGLNIQEITQYASQLASVTNSVGQTGEVSLAAAKSMTMLAGDISSLFNMDYSSVAQNLQSGLIGQSRALYKYGIDITNATLQTYAYEMGLSKAVSEMTQAEKMQLRMIAILDQSKVSWGDLANTINSPSNMIRQFTNNLKETGMVLGQLFIPVLSKVMPVINGVTIAIKRLLTNIAGFLGINLDLESFGQGYTDLGDDFEDIADGYEDAANAAEEYKNQILGFDEVTKLSEPTDSTSGIDVSGGTIDLTDEILAATSEYEKVWSAAYEQMENRAQEWADKISKYLKPIENIAQSLFEGDFFGAGVELGNAINNGISSIDWPAVGEWIGNKITGGLQFITGFATTLDWADAAKSLTSAINGMLKKISGKDFAKAINAIINGLWDFAITFVETLDWGELISTIGDILTNLDWDTVAKIGLTVAGIKLATSLIGTLASNLKKGFVSTISSTFANSSVVSAITSAGSGLGSQIANALTSPLMLIPAAFAGFMLTAINDTREYAERLETEYAEKTRNRITEATQAIVDNINEIIDTAISNSETRLQSFNDVTVDFAMLDDLADKYFNLAEKESLTNEEEEQLKVYHDMLISDYPELAEILDDKALSYKEQAQAVQDYIDKLQEQAIAEAAMESMKETYKDIIKLQKERSEIEDDYNKKYKDYMDAAAEIRSLNAKVAEQEAKVQEALWNGTQEEYEKANADLIKLQEQQLKADETWRTTSQNYFAIADSYNALGDEIQSLQDDVDFYTDAYVDATEKINGATTEMSTDVENSFSDVVSSAKDAVGNITKNFSATNFIQAGKNILSGLSTGAGDASKKKTFTEKIDSIFGTISDKFTSSNFVSLGTNILEGLKNGLSNNQLVQDVTTTVTSFASTVSNNFKKVLGIHSPSKVFEEFGEFTIAGYNIGLKDMFADSYSLITSWGTKLQKYAVAEVPDLSYNAPNISSSYDTNYVSQVDITNQEELALLRQQNQLLQALLQKEDVVISPDADGIFKMVQGKANNYTTQTGRPAFMV